MDAYGEERLALGSTAAFGPGTRHKINRKVAKPIMEKRRRARINASLNDLKSLLVEVLQKEGCRQSSKMEKADILEMTVKHLRELQQQRLAGQSAADLTSSGLERYALGYNECLNRIGEYLNSSEAPSAADSALRATLLSHVALPAPDPFCRSWSLSNQKRRLHTSSNVQSGLPKHSPAASPLLVPQQSPSTLSGLPTKQGEPKPPTDGVDCAPPNSATSSVLTVASIGQTQHRTSSPEGSCCKAELDDTLPVAGYFIPDAPPVVGSKPGLGGAELRLPDCLPWRPW